MKRCGTCKYWDSDTVKDSGYEWRYQGEILAPCLNTSRDEPVQWMTVVETYLCNNYEPRANND